MKTKKKINVAIDGTSSSGKSTMAKALATYAGYTYIDTGAMYRAVTLYCLQNGLIAEGKVNEEALAEHIADIRITFKLCPEGGQHTLLNGVDVEQQIRGLEVSNNVSLVAAIAFVRHEMVRQQQAMAKKKGVVMDGRDIGTTVLPNAEIKVFVTSSALVRAQRRYAEMLAKGDTSVTLEDIVKNVEMRDHLDSTREESPLRQAPDAIFLDSTPLTIEGQRQWLFDLFDDYMKTH